MIDLDAYWQERSWHLSIFTKQTSLLCVFAIGEFPTRYEPTVFDNYVAEIKLDGKPIQLALWDTAGQEEYEVSLSITKYHLLSYPHWRYDPASLFTATETFIICISTRCHYCFFNRHTRQSRECTLQVVGRGSKNGSRCARLTGRVQEWSKRDTRTTRKALCDSRAGKLRSIYKSDEMLAYKIYHLRVRRWLSWLELELITNALLWKMKASMWVL